MLGSARRGWTVVVSNFLAPRLILKFGQARRYETREPARSTSCVWQRRRGGLVPRCRSLCATGLAGSALGVPADRVGGIPHSEGGERREVSLDARVRHMDEQ
jgi:hypothetical protein